MHQHPLTPASSSTTAATMAASSSYAPRHSFDDPPVQEAMSKIAAALNLEARSEGDCFQAVFKLCRKRQWNTLEPLYPELSLIRNQQGRSLIQECIQQKDLVLARKLAKRRISVSTLDNQKNTSTHYAARTNDLKLLSLLSSCGNINAKNIERQTPLHAAALKGKLIAIQQLILDGGLLEAAAKVKIGETSWLNMTPLAIAILRKDQKSAELLLKAHATQPHPHESLKIKGMGSILHLVIQSNQIGFLKQLITHYPSLVEPLMSVGTPTGLTPFIFAASLGMTEALAEMMTFKPKLEEEDHEGQTALHHAVKNKHLQTVRFLVENGSDITHRDSNYESPLDLIENDSDPESEQIRQLFLDPKKDQFSEPPSQSLPSFPPPPASSALAAQVDCLT